MTEGIGFSRPGEGGGERKRLYRIGGPMGVGKTAVCRELQRRRGRDALDRSLSYLPLYETLDTEKLDVSRLTPGEAAARLEVCP